MKWSTKTFIILQVLDILLTFFAINLGIAIEANPLGFNVEMVLFKLFVIVYISYIMEKVEFGWLVYLLLAVPALVVIWNSLIIILGLYLYFR